MKNQVNLSSIKTIAGLSNIVISEIDETLYINSKMQIEDGIEGSVALYKKDGQIISCTGKNLCYNYNTETLSLDNLDVKNIKVNNLRYDYSKADYCEATKLSVVNWLGFVSVDYANCQPFKFQNNKSKATGKETLVLFANDYSKEKARVCYAVDDERFYHRTRVNLVPSMVNTPYGVEGDLRGDIKIDDNFFYYCFKDFDGHSKIWKRTRFEDWD